MNDKEYKKAFRIEASKNYEKYFPVESLKKLGYSRKKCDSCEKHFWSIKSDKVCGEPECEGAYSFIGKQRNPMSFTEVWEKFSKLMKSKGYTPIKRYPSLARWNDTTHFTIASIADFQPYVVSGAVEPPANPLTVPQVCLRFVDVDNVGISGRHNTGFTMIGQHAFLSKEDWNQSKLFEDYFSWYTEGMKLKKDEFKIHEDVWMGGGNFGPCMEFFTHGLEIGNQVYMMFERTGPTLKDRKELPIKVLDMGMGQERPAWFSQGTPTVYDAVFPEVLTYLKKETAYSPEGKILEKFIPYSGLINVDEVEDLEKVWKKISDETKIPLEELRAEVNKAAGLYSIADHTRALLYALADGAIPSNVGGNYNLRVLYRRMRTFMDKYNWKINIDKVLEIHAKSLKKEYPELLDNLENVKKILAVEERKYLENRKRNESLVKKFVSKDLKEKDLLKIYDTHGITPEEIVSEAKILDKKIKVPDNFYSLVAEMHEQEEQKTSTKKSEKKLNLKVQETEILYYDNYDLLDFEASVLYSEEGKVVLDRTAFYPTSGGQLHDVGKLNNLEVFNVYKEGKHVVHEIKGNLEKGQLVKGKINSERRIQLAQHHTATHVLMGSATRILGNHVWQAGAAKTEEKGRLDITHYDNLTNEDIDKIEELANLVISENRPVLKNFFDRTYAEQTYGFKIYQGGAVPGARIRIINIEGFDVQACGGTHLNTTGELVDIKIIKTSKLQDGIIRLEYVAGSKARTFKEQTSKLLKELMFELGCEKNQIPARCEELFKLWKKNKKSKEKIPFKLSSKETFEGDVLEEAARILKTQKEHLVKTVKRFKGDLS